MEFIWETRVIPSFCHISEKCRGKRGLVNHNGPDGVEDSSDFSSLFARPTVVCPGSNAMKTSGRHFLFNGWDWFRNRSTPQWIASRENLQETMDFSLETWRFPVDFPTNPLTKSASREAAQVGAEVPAGSNDIALFPVASANSIADVHLGKQPPNICAEFGPIWWSHYTDLKLSWQGLCPIELTEPD